MHLPRHPLSLISEQRHKPNSGYVLVKGWWYATARPCHRTGRTWPGLRKAYWMKQSPLPHAQLWWDWRQNQNKSKHKEEKKKLRARGMSWGETWPVFWDLWGKAVSRSELLREVYKASKLYNPSIMTDIQKYTHVKLAFIHVILDGVSCIFHPPIMGISKPKA